VPEIAPKEEAKVPEMAPREEAKVPEIAPKEEAKIERKKEARPEEKPAPFDLAGLRIQFAFDDYNLSSQAKENLEKVASWMSKNPVAKIQIQGNTCNIGTAEYNLALGENRAMTARRYLQGLGVSSSRISTISYGMEKPMLPNTDETNRSKNRRDEFVQTK
jgi:peptidoglycan-associated lipoprotein